MRFVTSNTGSETRSLYDSIDVKSTRALAPLVRGSAKFLWVCNGHRAGFCRASRGGDGEQHPATTAQNLVGLREPPGALGVSPARLTVKEMETLVLDEVSRARRPPLDKWACRGPPFRCWRTTSLRQAAF